jgi:glucosyl-3-phosphoglycerate synthase
VTALSVTSGRTRTFDVGSVTVDDVRQAKGGRTVSVCLPCRNEAGTVGDLVAAIRGELMCHVPVVDELIVVDDGSEDATARLASRAGATVVPVDDVHRRHGSGRGKGNALWASMIASRGDFVVWCDGDVTSFEPGWVLRLLAPLLDDDSVALVKASYERPTNHGGGGRTTELVARPLLSLYFPELAELDQPLSGEYAGRRSALEQIPFAQGWGVEVAMLIDLARRFGPGCIGQVDLGRRVHRHRDLSALSVQAGEVMATVLARAGALPTVDEGMAGGGVRPGAAAWNLAERPPVSDLTSG